MIDRRKFLQGVAGVFVAAALPAIVGGESMETWTWYFSGVQFMVGDWITSTDPSGYDEVWQVTAVGPEGMLIEKRG